MNCERTARRAATRALDSPITDRQLPMQRQIAASRIIELLVVMSLIVILATMGLAQYRHERDPRAGSGAEGRSVPDARRDRSVLRRQDQYPSDARSAGHRRLPAEASRRSVHEEQHAPGRPSPPNPTPTIPPPSPASTTSRAARTPPRSTARNTPTGRTIAWSVTLRSHPRTLNAEPAESAETTRDTTFLILARES